MSTPPIVSRREIIYVAVTRPKGGGPRHGLIRLAIACTRRYGAHLADDLLKRDIVWACPHEHVGETEARNCATAEFVHRVKAHRLELHRTWAKAAYVSE